MEAGPPVSWCGRAVFGEWYFVSTNHALLNRRNKGARMICPKCMGIIETYLSRDKDLTSFDSLCLNIRDSTLIMEPDPLLQHMLNAVWAYTQATKVTVRMELIGNRPDSSPIGQAKVGE